MKVSIVMSTFNRAHLLDLGLSSILKQDIRYNFEIIVVNDGCEDNTEEVCEKYFNKCQLKYYFSGEKNKNGIIPRCPSIPQNIGIMKSTGDIIILTCPEIFHLNLNGINNIIEPLINNKNFLTIPKVMWFDDDNYYTAKLLLNIEEKMSHCTIDNDSVVMPFLMGIWRTHLMHIGGYDEDFTGYASDDNDLIDRLKLIGCSHHKVDAEIIHLYHGKRCTGQYMWDNPDWVYNYNLYQKKKDAKTLYEKNNAIIRNKLRNWGEL